MSVNWLLLVQQRASGDAGHSPDYAVLLQVKRKLGHIGRVELCSPAYASSL